MSAEVSKPAAGAGATTLQGIGVSPGLALGPALVFLPQRALSAAPRAASTEAVAMRIESVRLALAAAAAELRALAADLRRAVGADEAGILEAQVQILEDPVIAARAQELIDGEDLDGAEALAQAAEEQAHALAALPDPLWQARAADVRDAANRALRHLVPAWGGEDLPSRIAHVGMPVIVIAADMVPSDTAQLSREHVLGLCTAAGSSTSHAAILMHALGIPAVVGVGQALLTAAADGDTVALDGTAGLVHLHPDPTTVAQLGPQLAAQKRREGAARAEALQWATRPGQTRDGSPVRVLANVGSIAEAAAAAERGAEGIGLLRTEFLFADRSTLPDEQEQAALYSAIVAALKCPDAPIVVRTLDAGNDKPLPALVGIARELPAETNPALGVRGIRLNAVFPMLLEVQLRALVRAAAATGADLHVMLPMVATIEEVREGVQVLRAAEAALAREGVCPPHLLPLGIMIETPAAVLRAEALAREAAFFSIGTNDLAQYVMAADRLNPLLAPLADGRQPAVLHAIAQVAAVARRANRPVAVCGEAAADPQLAGLLVGLGVGELSMTPASIPAVKRLLASKTLAELKELGAQALAATTVAEVAALLHA